MAKITVPIGSCLNDEASPDLCMVCGNEPSERNLTQTYNATYCSPVAILGFFVFSIFGFLLLYFLLKKSQPVRIKQCAKCAAHRQKLPIFLGLNWVLCLLLLFGGVGVASSASPGHEYLDSIGGFMCLAAFVYWAIYSRRYNVSCAGISNESVYLNLPNNNYAYNFANYVRTYEPAPVRMTCQKCRVMIPSDANFCSGCGQSVSG